VRPLGFTESDIPSPEVDEFVSAGPLSLHETTAEGI
jgi:hypothetical protein